MNTPRRILRLPEVEHMTGYRRSSIYRMIEKEEFPKQRKIGPGAVGWDSWEIEAWIEEKLGGSA